MVALYTHHHINSKQTLITQLNKNSSVNNCQKDNTIFAKLSLYKNIKESDEFIVNPEKPVIISLTNNSSIENYSDCLF